MKQVHISKTRLQEILLHNRNKHQEEYEEAVAEWKQALQRKFTEAITSIKDFENKLKEESYNDFLKCYTNGDNGPNWNVSEIDVWLCPPKSHVHDYDRCLRMLEHEVNDEVVLDKTEYQNLVEDNWSWKEHFNLLKMSYTQG